MEVGTSFPSLVPRCCHIVRWPEFNGYGFNLHAEKGKAGQFIGKVDPGSPAEAAGLRQGDRIVEVNGINIGNENHQQVVARIKSGGDETRLLVVDGDTDMHYKKIMTVVRGDLPEVRFITSAKDEIDSSTPATTTTNGSAAAAGTPADGGPATTAVYPQFPVRLCKLRKWPDFDGYGFNLHAEKDKPGQYIGVVDPESPAETGGLKEGDRIVEVNGENIEGLAHSGVIQRVKAVGDRAELLVVDREADAFYRNEGLSLRSDLVGVTVLTTPATSKGDVEDINCNEQSYEPEPVLTTFNPAEEQTSYSFEKKEEAEVIPSAETETPVPAAEAEVAATATETEVAAFAAETEMSTAEEDRNVSTLPEPNVSLSDEETEAIVAVVAEAVESTPEPHTLQEEETVANGHEVEKEEEEDREVKNEEPEKEEEEEEQQQQVVVVTSTSDVTPIDDIVPVEEEKKEEEEGGEGLNDYEQVEVVAAAVAVPAFSAPPPVGEDHADEDLGAASYGINGGEEVPEPEPDYKPAEPPAATIPTATAAPEPVPERLPEPVPEPVAQPAPAVIGSTMPSSYVSSNNSSNNKPAPTGPAMGGDLHLFMSAAEMKERLKARKKQDPRFHKTSFEAKSKMFEKL